MNDASQLNRHLQRVLPDAIALRRDLHANPETALEERETRERIREFLGDDFQYREPLLGTDLIAELPGEAAAGGCIALRADMDALAVEEKTGVPWVSRNPGRMHACGHDGHMAVLAGTARLLARIDPSMGIVIPRTVRFVFQPGEEVIGAGRQLADAGAYEGARSAYAFHGWPGLPRGTVGIKEGVAFGASHHFRALFRGVGTHGAYPERGRNPLPAVSRAVLQLETLHRELYEANGEVVSCCVLSGGAASNVIPGEAELAGTVRYVESSRNAELEAAVRRILKAAAREFGVELSVDYDTAYDQPVVNDPYRCETVRRTAKEASIPVIPETTIERASEDFAFALTRIPGCLFKLGLGEDQPPLHSDRFDFPDEALATGIHMMTRLALGGA